MSKNDESLRSERLAFYEEELGRMDLCLEEFLKLSGAKAALLIDRDGHLVTQKGESASANLDTISALVAGSFAATKQVAQLLGEKQFHALVHQGETDSVLIHLVGSRSLLTVLFDQKTTLGMVRLYTQEAAKRLEEIFSQAENHQELDSVAPPFGSDYQENANQQIDEIFDR